MSRQLERRKWERLGRRASIAALDGLDPGGVIDAAARGKYWESAIHLAKALRINLYPVCAFRALQ